MGVVLIRVEFHCRSFTEFIQDSLFQSTKVVSVSFNKLDHCENNKSPSCPDVAMLQSISDIVIDGKLGTAAAAREVMELVNNKKCNFRGKCEPCNCDCEFPRGPSGPKGEPGCQGGDGCQGGLGLEGRMGAPGDKGPAGIRGPKGECGPCGVPGLPSSMGEPGPTGVEGVDGVPGTPGPQGDEGEKGAKGAKGVKGYNGADGQEAFQGMVDP